MSAVNLTLLSILYLQEKGIYPLVGKSILSNYSHTLERLICKRRPFSSFFGNFRSPNAQSIFSTVYVDELWLTIIEDLDWRSSKTILKLNKINEELVAASPSSVYEYINYTPSSWPESYDLAIHYRGCDYLENVPKDHHKNFDKETFFEKCMPFVDQEKTLFVATDDNTFLGFLAEKGLKFFAFRDVMRGNPGRGVHAISKRQELGLEPLVNPFLRGIQVLRDCTHMSRSRHYVGTNSNLMYYSNVLNPRIKVTNLFESKV